MELKGSKTEANLWYAFAGESQARNKYSYFASKAKKETTFVKITEDDKLIYVFCRCAPIRTGKIF